MNKAMNKSYESTISTTATTGSPPFSDTMENNVKYMNLNFVDNSESSSQVKDMPVEYQKMQISYEAPKIAKPPPSKILPTSLPITGKTDCRKVKMEAVLKEKTLVEMGFKSNEIDGWENIVQPPKENLYKLLKSMIDNHIKPNVQIRIGGVTFNCHMMVLQCYSDFFMECSNEVLIQLPEEKITPGAFMMVYDWMLAEEPLVQREGILELFNAANFLRIKDLINQCWLCLDDDVRFREDTAFLLYLEARSYGLESLEQLMLTRICKFFLTLVASKEFLDLNAKEICTLLSSNTIGVNSEIEIFMSVVRWLSHNWEEREPEMLNIVKCIRFSLMPPWFLVTLNKSTDCEEIDRIACHPEVKKMINDGISFTTTQLYYGENREEFLHFLERYQLVAPMQRQWVFDKECKYHHRLECPNMQYVTYKSFLEYLEMIQSIGKDYWHSLDMAKSNDKNVQCCARADSRKANDKNVGSEYAKKVSRDQGIQVETNVRQRKTLTRDAKPFIDYRVDNISVKPTEIVHKTQPRQEYDQVLIAEILEYNDCDERYDHCSRRSTWERHYRKHEKKYMKIDRKKPENTTQTAKKNNNYQQQKQQEQQQKQISKEEEQNYNKTENERCTGGGGGGGGGVVGEYLQISNEPQTLYGETSSMLLTIKAATKSGEDENVDKSDDRPMPMYKHGLLTCSVMEFNQITNKKILIFGGIDPYCPHCKRLEGKQTHQQQQSQQQQSQQLQSLQRKFTRRRLLHYESTTSTTTTTTSNNDVPVSGAVNDAFADCRTGDVNVDGAGAGAGGAGTGGTASNDIENYGDQVLFCEANNLQWRHLSRIPFGSRHHHSATFCNGLIYIVGGTRTALGCTKKSVFEKSVWSFDPKTLKWAVESTLPEPRRDFAVIAIDGTNERCPRSKKLNLKALGTGFFVIGGEGMNGIALETVWFYDVLRKLWSKKASLNVGRYGFAATLVNNEIWIAGGIINDKISTNIIDASGDAQSDTVKTTADVITDSMEYYSLKCATRKRTAAPPRCGYCDIEGGGHWIRSKLYLRIPRLFGKFCRLSSTELYLVGGIGFSAEDFLVSLSSVDYFDFNTATWQLCGDINSARHGHDVAALNDLIIIIGGVSTIKKRTLSKVDAFCTRTRKPLKGIPELPWPLSGSAIVTLP